MENELKDFVEIFNGYRKTLLPVQESLHSFVETYDGLKTDLGKMSDLFDGDINGKLDSILNSLKQQSQKSVDLSSRIDLFLNKTNKYIVDLTNINSLFETANEKLTSINDIETQTENQLKKLDEIIEDKKINYNIKDLQKSLDIYNSNVEKMSEFINKDVAEKLNQNSDKILNLKQENENLKKLIEYQNTSINELCEMFKSTNEILSNIVQKESVNEEYIFDVLDKWAISRKDKIKN